uniref:Signal transducing adaptor family member 1 n=1 Tax=Nothoprocta perdicaria TaxID=30464 RepID=A0A8C6YYV5_NOTPE
MEEPENIPKPAPRRIFHERQRVTRLPLYLEGYLSIRHPRHQEFEVNWAELRGTTLFFYSDKKAPTVSNILSLAMGVSQVKTRYSFLLQPFLNCHFLFSQAEDSELGKEWKGFILTVTKMSVPLDESLSPSQLMRMHEVLEKEKKRRMVLNDHSSASADEESSPPRNYSSILTAMPACFHAVSRQGAIEMLEKNPSYGNLILRPGSSSKNFAVTIRHCFFLFFPPMKQVTVSTLHDVIDYFVTQTRRHLKPFVIPADACTLQRASGLEGKLAAGDLHRN